MSRGLPETVLPASPAAWIRELEAALCEPPELRRDALARVAADHPKMLDAWSHLSACARDQVEAYAYARVGYHRGLDALRGAGWHGTGYVRWSEEANRGFLRCVNALRLCARAIGEADEEQRCSLFLRQLDPTWTDPL
jgi:hypothetical protein